MPSRSTSQRHPAGQGSTRDPGSVRPQPGPRVGLLSAAGSRTPVAAVRTLEPRVKLGSSRGSAGTSQGPPGHSRAWGGRAPPAPRHRGPAKAAGLGPPPEAARPRARAPPPAATPSERLALTFRGGGGAAGPGPDLCSGCR